MTEITDGLQQVGPRANCPSVQADDLITNLRKLRITVLLEDRISLHPADFRGEGSSKSDIGHGMNVPQDPQSVGADQSARQDEHNLPPLNWHDAGYHERNQSLRSPMGSFTRHERIAECSALPHKAQRWKRLRRACV